jgi:thioredoxin-related protein
LKSIATLFLLFCFISYSNAQNENSQTNDTTPIYKQFPDVPAFTLNRFPDSAIVTKQDLKKKTPTIIILFSPDCDHCKTATKDLISNIEYLKKAEIIMVSNLNFSWIKRFDEEFNLTKYDNITLATQPNFFLYEFYNLSSFPAVFVYDKKGKLIGDYKQHIDFKEIANLLKQK